MFEKRTQIETSIFYLDCTDRYIGVLSINIPAVKSCLDQIYPLELEIKDKTKENTSASYLNLLLLIGRGGQLHTSIRDKRDDFIFHIFINELHTP